MVMNILSIFVPPKRVFRKGLRTSECALFLSSRSGNSPESNQLLMKNHIFVCAVLDPSPWGAIRGFDSPPRLAKFCKSMHIFSNSSIH